MLTFMSRMQSYLIQSDVILFLKNKINVQTQLRVKETLMKLYLTTKET